MRSTVIRLSAAILMCPAFVLHPSSAQTLSEQQDLRSALERRDSTSALVLLKKLQSSNPNTFKLNNYDYLLGRISELRGNRARSTANYQAVVLRRSALSQYALWHLAQFSRASGNLTLEREQLRQLISSAPSSLLREAATFRLGQSFFESGDYDEAVAALRQVSAPKMSTAARSALSLIGQAYLRSGRAQAAREVFDGLISEATDPSKPDDYSLQAARNLDELDAQKPNDGSGNDRQLTEVEHSRRAAIYQFNREFAAARNHYQALVSDYPQGDAVPDALYQIGRGLFQEGKYDYAIEYFQKVQQKFPASPGARDALGLLAAAQNRLKQTDAAVASYKLFIEHYPAAPNPERPYLNIIDTLREAGHDNEAFEWIQQTRTRFKGQMPATLALFAQVRVHFAQSSWSLALDDLEKLQKETELSNAQTAGGTSPAEVAFMRSYALEQLGRIDEAVDAYLGIPDGRNEYYGARATLRLRALTKRADQQSILAKKLEAFRAAARQALDTGDAERARASAQAALRLTEDDAITRDLLEIARRAYGTLPAYNSFPSLQMLAVGRQGVITSTAAGVADTSASNAGPSHQMLADELLFLGLYDEGAPELAAARLEKPVSSVASNAPANVTNTTSRGPEPGPPSSQAQASSKDLEYTLAVCFLRGGNANQALRFVLPLWKNVPRDYLLELAPRQMTELMYPAPYSNALLKTAPPRGLDPRFLLAIARQESGFLPQAKSASAARGLMQFVSATANTIASQLGKRSFRDEQLYDPSVSILFGAQYVSNLFKTFPDMPQAVAAAYNGGDENVVRWVARSRSNDADRYVPEIGFAQTKDYVHRVMSNYRAYKILYSDQLQPR